MHSCLNHAFCSQCSNPYITGFGVPPPYKSALQWHRASLADPTVSMATAFKSIMASSIASNRKQPTEICGDERAKIVLSALIQAHGWEPVDCGGIDDAPKLEPRGPLRQKHPRITEYDVSDPTASPQTWDDPLALTQASLFYTESTLVHRRSHARSTVSALQANNEHRRLLTWPSTASDHCATVLPTWLRSISIPVLGRL